MLDVVADQPGDPLRRAITKVATRARSSAARRARDRRGDGEEQEGRVAAPSAPTSTGERHGAEEAEPGDAPPRRQRTASRWRSPPTANAQRERRPRRDQLVDRTGDDERAEQPRDPVAGGRERGLGGPRRSRSCAPSGQQGRSKRPASSVRALLAEPAARDRDRRARRAGPRAAASPPSQASTGRRAKSSRSGEAALLRGREGARSVQRAGGATSRPRRTGAGCGRARSCRARWDLRMARTRPPALARSRAPSPGLEEARPLLQPMHPLVDSTSPTACGPQSFRAPLLTSGR